jgi:hypothetical protein
MLTITIEDRTYELPESWDDIKFDRYINVLKVIEKQPEFGSMTLKVIDQIIAISKEQPGLKEDIMNLSYQDLSTLLGEYIWLTEQPDYKKYSKNQVVEVEGKKYLLKQEYGKLTANEMIMLEELIGSQKFDLHHLEIAFGILVRPLDEEGNEVDLNIEVFKETINTLRDKFYLKDIFPIVGFFLDGGKASTTNNSKSSLSSLTITKGNMQLKKKQTKAKR